MAEDSKTEKASPKKRRDERKKGNVFKSQDIITIVSLLAGFYALQFLGPLIYRTGKEYMITYLNRVGDMDTISHEGLMVIQNQTIIAAALMGLPLLLIAVAVAVLTTGIQTRFLMSWKNLAPKLNRISPISGLKKMFAMRNVIELIKNVLKITLLIYILFRFMQDRVSEVPNTMNMGLEDSFHYVMAKIMELIRSVAMWFVAIAAFDLLYQWWDYERQIKMSKQEVKEEYKQTEGNPEIKGRIKELQRQMAKSRMMQSVPTADVVVRNPTHYAVALKYDPDKNSAPVVVAKGQDELALRIVRVAEENHVHVVENQPLARAIYATTRIDQEIPPEFYGMVAELLVYIYKLNHKVVQ